ncbi:MAG: NAD-dependent epimerase/dehydratase family protein [Gemmatimonadales bacterium]
MRVLVTGADGFAGGWLVRRLLAAGAGVTGTHRLGGEPSRLLERSEHEAVTWRSLELRDRESVRAAVDGSWDAVAHLAGLASGAEARRDPGLAWDVNAGGTARIAEALGGGGTRGPLLLVVSTGEVYGAGASPRTESDPCVPTSPYAASKLGAELAAQETSRRTGLRVVIARAFPHTGPGQDARFVLPALASRLLEARAAGAREIASGPLDPVRDLLDVRDVAAAYEALLRMGVPGEIYNVASGAGLALREVLDRLCRLAGWEVTPSIDPARARAGDLGRVVGDPAKLREATGWEPRIPMDQTLADLLDAQAH